MNRRLLILSFLSILLFIWTFHISFLENGKQVAQQVATAIGVSSSVAPNESNLLAQQLAEKEQELTEREAALLTKEQTDTNHFGIFSIEWYTTVMALILLVLVLLNFYLDWKREERGV